MDMKGYYSVSLTKKHTKHSFFSPQFTTRQHQCKQENHLVSEQTSLLNHSLKLSSSTSQNNLPPILHVFVTLLLFFTSISPILSHPILSNSTSSQQLISHNNNVNQTFRPDVALHKLKRIRAHLKKINKPAVKTIKAFCFLLLLQYFLHFSCDSVIWIKFFYFFLLQSPDGDLIDCIISHQQPAFDHPKLKGHKPLVIHLIFHPM